MSLVAGAHDGPVTGPGTGTRRTWASCVRGLVGRRLGGIRRDRERFLDGEHRASAGSQGASPADRRVVYGIVAIQKFTEGDGYVVQVGGTMHVVDLQSGRMLYTRTLSTRSRANNASSAISAAFQSIGRTFGRDIARKLP